MTRRANHATKTCPALLEKYFALAVGQISATTRPILSRKEGRIAIVTNAGRDAVDAAASAREVIAGRSSRERSARRTNGACTAYGKTVWSWHPWLVSSCR